MKLFFRKSGEGPPLIILHGLYGSSDNWISIAKNVSDICTVYLPDQRNHGQSPHSEIHDYDSMCDDLHELVTGLRLKKFFLAGHSMGGKTAAAFATRYPEMLNGLMVADISPFISEKVRSVAYNQHLNILTTIISVDLDSVKSREEADNMLRDRISSPDVRGFLLKNLRRNQDSTFSWKLNASGLLNNLDNIMNSIDLDKAASLPVCGFPVVFLKGSLSNYIQPEDIAGIREIFPAAEFTVINGAGHWLHADKPEEVTAALRDLLSYE